MSVSALAPLSQGLKASYLTISPQNTLLKAPNAAVYRRLSVTASVSFECLHAAIVASFGWSQEEIRWEDRSSPAFNVVQGKSFETTLPELMKTSYAVVEECGGALYDHEGYEVRNLGRTKVHEVPGNLGYYEIFLTYVYGDAVLHAMPMLGQSMENIDGKITCIGG